MSAMKDSVSPDRLAEIVQARRTRVERAMDTDGKHIPVGDSPHASLDGYRMGRDVQGSP